MTSPVRTIWVTAIFNGTFEHAVPRHSRPSAIEMDKALLEDLWWNSDPCRLFDLVHEVKVYDYTHDASKTGWSRFALHDPRVVYQVSGEVENDDDLMMLIMKHDAKLQQPDVPCFKR